ncbi:hypothetical protein [Escherichia coli]|uniref:hypothetical protein n=1 Tax=Escherichia coli TaxID=562 RepID=UPI001554F9BE|nr:hypothetical protein [Escherichia coli]
MAGSEQESARGSFRGETPGIFIVLSGFATSGLSVDFCDARQGGRSLWKNACGAGFFRCFAFCSHVLSGFIP